MLMGKTLISSAYPTPILRCHEFMVQYERMTRTDIFRVHLKAAHLKTIGETYSHYHTYKPQMQSVTVTFRRLQTLIVLSAPSSRKNLPTVTVSPKIVANIVAFEMETKSMSLNFRNTQHTVQRGMFGV